MDTDYTRKILDILQFSSEEATRHGHVMVGPTTLFLGLMREEPGELAATLPAIGVDVYRIRTKVEALLADNPDKDILADAVPEESATLSLTTEASQILRIARLEARSLGAPQMEPIHLLLAFLRVGHNNPATALSDFGISYRNVRGAVSTARDVDPGTMRSAMDDDDDDDTLYAPRDGEAPAGHAETATATAQANGDTPVLNSFSTDLTAAAAEGKLDPVIGRDKEIERIAQILSRRKKNNPVLIGEPGVGKSAIVEGLALRIVQKKTTRMLFGMRVVSLDMGAVVAGTKYRGQFEERIRAIIGELKKNPDIILFIDEIHTMVGAGNSTGSMDAANMLKPALSRGEIRCIGATTLNEYRNSIEKDGALERRFQKVIVEPTATDETRQILMQIKDCYEKHHNVTYSDKAIDACVKMADRYITDRAFPDKAIDVMDEAGSRAHITHITISPEIEEKEKFLDTITAAKNEAVRNQRFEEAAELRDTEQRMQVVLEQMKRDWQNANAGQSILISEEDIAAVVSTMSGIPVHRIAQAEGIRLKGMKAELNRLVIAQESAIDKLVRAIRRNRVGLKDPARPIGTFMFLGPTGVGKTLLAKELARYMFGTADALIRIDMSEYMEKFTVSRLVGAPPGYVGYEEGGQLTEKVRRRPYSIVLLDEIEKAHPDVFNLLLQVTDEGRLTDSYGRVVDFRNTVIIMTSNVGSRQLKDFGKGIGFGTYDGPAVLSSEATARDREHSRSVVQKALNKTFSPEFINRIDEIITFDPLDREALDAIVRIEVSKLTDRIQALGTHVVIADSALAFLALKGYDPQYGARPLKRAIQNYLEDALSECIIETPPAEGQHISVTAEPDATELTVSIVDDEKKD